MQAACLNNDLAITKLPFFARRRASGGRLRPARLAEEGIVRGGRAEDAVVED